MRLIKSRWLRDTDRAGTAVLNESMAREAFGAIDSIWTSARFPNLSRWLASSAI